MVLPSSILNVVTNLVTTRPIETVLGLLVAVVICFVVLPRVGVFIKKNKEQS
jgi:hypothetical protein